MRRKRRTWKANKRFAWRKCDTSTQYMARPQPSSEKTVHGRSSTTMRTTSMTGRMHWWKWLQITIYNSEDKLPDTVFVSLCLLGVPCRYHGMTHRMGHRIGRKKLIERLHATCHILPLCGEQMGGLPTPRPPCKVVGDRVITKKGDADVTCKYHMGADLILEQCLRFNVKKAYLLRDSPMCDRDNGVLGRLLRANDIRVIKVW